MDFAGNRCTLNAMLESLSLPGYEIGEVMHDGMTRAVRQSDLKSVLLKTVPEKSRPETPARLRREFEIARSLPLEIAPYLDLLEGNRWPILVLEDRSFVTLDDWNWASLKDFLIVASRLAIALDTVHESGLVHRDIHPGSILVDAENRNIAIIDYGISSLYSGRSGSVSPGSQIEGTLLYMAPEQTGRTNRHIDHRSDIYSLGATLYKALGGDPPYDLNDALQLINAHLTRTPERLKKDRNGGFVPDILNEILLRLMARDQEDRYQTAMGLAMDLRKCLDRLEGNNQIPLFSVGEGDFPRGLTIPQKLYGRQRELKQLRDCLEDSARTPLVLVTGQSGSGKSSLVQEFRRTVSEKQGYFLSGKFEPDKKDIPYYGIARCIAELVEILLARDSGQVKEEILPRLRGNGQVLVNTVPSLEKLLGPQPEPAELAPEEERTRFRLTLLAFLGSFADSPLVFFLDDLQWADLASLDLIQDLLEYREYSLNILGTYREEEVNELHPLSRAKESYQLAGISSQVIHLKPLGPRDLKLMLLDTFRIGAEDDDAAGVADLADLLYKKSEGNPFVARQYLESLYEKQLIRQDRDSGTWRFDLARIRTDGLSSSAAELLAARIASLPDCQEVLTAAACLGNRFSLASLAALAGQDILFTLEQLQTIAGADIIYPLSENYKYISTESSRRDMEDVELAFSHDRIHEAVLAQIPPSRLEQLNLDAARLILDRSDYQQIQERIGSIVSHYNQGRNLVWEDDEKLKIAELNLKAGLKERRSSAIDEAIIHFGIALDTLHQRKAAIPRDLQMELLRNLGEAEYLRGRKIVAQEYFDKVLKQSRDLLEKLKVFDFKIALLASAGQHSEAVGVGLQALKSAGFKIRSYSKSQEKKLLQSWTKPALKFVDLQRKRRKKKAPAPEKSSLARILAQTITPAFLLDSGYLPSLLDTLLELSRKDGPFPETSVAMVLLGALLGPGADGRKIGDQALDLAERYNAVELRGRVHYYYLSAIHPWNQPWESGIPRYRRAADYCLEAGDLPFAALSLLEFLSRQVLLCRNLPDLEIVPRYEQEIVRTGQEDSIELYWLLRQVAQNFQAGGKNKTRLQGDFFDEDKHAKNWKGRKSFYLSLYKHWLAYVFFPDVSALPPLVGSENWPRAHIDTILYEYLRIALPFMTGAGRYSESACDELLSRLAELEKDAPPDFAFMRHHLQAEKRWKLGQVQEAMTAFDLACEAPQQPLFAGIIHERTAQFYLWMEKPRFARIYAEKARSIYSTMQSHTQIQQAERLLDEIRMMEYRQRPDAATEEKSEASALKEAKVDRDGQWSASREGSELDLEAIMQMANIVSSRLDLDELIRSLLLGIMDNAGARKAALLEKSADGYVIRGLKNPNEEPELNSLRKPDPGRDLALNVAHYAESMQEPVVLDNARESRSFSTDPYIENGKIASILCIPLLLKGEVTNILYLEHPTSRSAFSSERVRILSLLGTQIATSLENARLYENVRQALAQEQKARQSEARINTVIRRFVPDEFLKILGITDFVDVKLGQNIEREMTVLFSDIRSFTSLSESMSPEENFRFINSYLSRIGPLVRESGGFIDKYIGDAVMALFEKPDQAIRAARAMMLELDAYNSGRSKGGYEPIRIGVGLHTGVLRLGIIGEEGRIEGTVIGDTVNLASRLEGLNRSYGSSVIASDATVEYMKGSTLFAFRALDRVRVKGKQRDTWIYEMLLHPPDPRWLKNYEKALQAYQEARFSESREHFLKLKEEKPDDAVIDLYLNRLESLPGKSVPEDWEGIENLTKK